MPKRNRTRTRTNEATALAITVNQQGWTEDRIENELATLVARNPDLVDIKSIETFKLEFRKFANPRLAGHLSKLVALASRRIDEQDAGGKLRYNHELSKFCNIALKHPKGPGIAIKEIENSF